MANKKAYDLICFDVDGTLVRHPSNMVIWEVLNLRYGGSKEINRLRYQMYCEGKLSYERWVQLDVQTWIDAGATRDQILESVRELRRISRTNTVRSDSSSAVRMDSTDCMYRSICSGFNVRLRDPPGLSFMVNTCRFVNGKYRAACKAPRLLSRGRRLRAA
ncbi:MAG: hypothetical protein P8181_16200, partial [bacterium]